jgi:hypothetical protein
MEHADPTPALPTFALSLGDYAHIGRFIVKRCVGAVASFLEWTIQSGRRPRVGSVSSAWFRENAAESAKRGTSQ